MKLRKQCPISGCNELETMGNLLCLKHSVEVWANVETAKGDPLRRDEVLESVDKRKQREADAEAALAERRQTEGWIYYIRLDDKIKIGWTSDLVQRMRSYPPHRVSLVEHPGTRADERDLHRTFAPSRSSGREWYFPTPELLAHIERMKAEVSARGQAAYEASRSLSPPPPASVRRSKPRPKRGAALVREILGR